MSEKEQENCDNVVYVVYTLRIDYDKRKIHL